jgi:hypothetical protein
VLASFVGSVTECAVRVAKILVQLHYWKIEDELLSLLKFKSCDYTGTDY